VSDAASYPAEELDSRRLVGLKAASPKQARGLLAARLKARPFKVSVPPVARAFKATQPGSSAAPETEAGRPPRRRGEEAFQCRVSHGSVTYEHRSWPSRLIIKR
jgi:hypothetical protein